MFVVLEARVLEDRVMLLRNAKQIKLIVTAMTLPV